jgi:uncharacterized membrane protein YedE/YeeE
MEWDRVIYSLLGGGLIGAAASLMLLFNGRVTGVSGIISSSLSLPQKDGLWRWFFLIGLLSGGLLIRVFQPELFVNLSGRSNIATLVAGILVGFGTVMGSGCTSGHGVCGVSRLSVRSFIATMTFMLFGFLTVQAIHFFTGGNL